MPTTLLHIPHSSSIIPPEYRGCFALNDEQLRRESIRMIDAHTAELFVADPHIAHPLVFPVSRLLVDPERFLDDSREPMAQRGMGVLYTRTSSGDTLRTEAAGRLRDELIERYYRPHHDALSRFVEAALEAAGHALIIDCHSFPSKALPCHHYGTDPIPDICIGTDPVHTPPALADAAKAFFAANGLTVALDHPFSGSIVPASHYRKDARVHSLMIEVNRALYMNEQTGEPHDGFKRLQEMLFQCISHLNRKPLNPSPSMKSM
jgi:N-formylglutamate deformylase